MCVSWAGRVIRLEDDGTAIVEVDGRRLRMATIVCPGIKAGRWVVVATGLVLREISAREARRLAALPRTAA
jgi:hydrogenase maturation factor